MMMPIIVIMLIVPRDTSMAKNTPIIDSGSDIAIASGCRKLSNCDARNQVNEDDRQDPGLPARSPRSPFRSLVLTAQITV